MVLGKKDLWEANSPPSLLDTVSRLCLRRLDILTEADEDEEGGGRRRLKADVFLPAEICENLIAAAAEEDLDVFSDSMVNIFRPGQANLRNIAIQEQKSYVFMNLAWCTYSNRTNNRTGRDNH